MDAALRFTRIYLVIPLAFAIASYASIISMELSADDYGAVVEPPAPPMADAPLPGELDPSTIERAHREKITARTVSCTANCDAAGQWGSFVDLTYEKQKIDADADSPDSDQKTKDRIVTAGIDRRFGQHLFGVSFGASDGEGKVELDFSAIDPLNPDRYDGLDNIMKIDRDKYSAGLYYGVTLPYYISFSAQVLASDYSYHARWFDPVLAQDDSARYDGDGYSGAVSLSAIVPMISLSPRFDFLFQPSISYQYVRTDTDPYTSELSVDFGARKQRTKDLQFAVKWRVPRFAGQSIVIPYGGFAYTHIERRLDARGLSGEPIDFTIDHDLFEGLVGLTLQRKNFNTTVSFKKTIGSDELERERYQLIFRLRF